MIAEDESMDSETELSSDELMLGTVEPYSDMEVIDSDRSTDETSETARRGGANEAIGVNCCSSKEIDTSVLLTLIGTHTSTTDSGRGVVSDRVRGVIGAFSAGGGAGAGAGNGTGTY